MSEIEICLPTDGNRTETLISEMKQESILLDLLRVISHHRARLATPIRTVQKIYGEADLENVPFAGYMIIKYAVI